MGRSQHLAQELKQACEQMNLQVKELSELITDQEMLLQLGGGEVVAGYAIRTLEVTFLTELSKLQN